MEQVLPLLNTVLQVVLVEVFALTPGIAVWLIVAGIVVAVRRIKGIGLHRRVLVGREPAIT